ncbi:type VI secretion system tip protein TssI/VgrG [Candidatus Methylospira mobilis]|uniref:type VI secretion system tip protein TssI/VgrG n=1 Tax=Candidatus Methylospira mobilis TaxID=1808979 RepID=UPI0028EA8C15|nr:type VI secretion system tip protein TssI/VgrG [Candidatus Methylospira mobilis]WNV06554.1 type VI secretion system tip protein TssI/VgrG [Candidatus Methylospira mobilis]
MTENKGSLFSDRRYAFSAGGLAPDTFEVVRFEGEEALSALYRFDLLLASRDSDIDERVLLGQLAQFSLNDGVEGGRPTVYRGLLRSFAYQYQISGWTFYRATLAPKMWLLDTFYLSEVYLDMDRHEIFTTVMQNAGFLFDDFDLRFQKGSAAYSKRDYICQYRESYLSFIARWAERLGIYWWYEESDGREKIIFSDTRMAHKDEGLLLNYQDAGELDAAMGRKRRLQSLELEACNLPKKIVVRDYSAQRASMEIMGTAAVDPHGNGEEHIFGEHLKSNGEAAHIAKLRAEGVLARGNIYRGGTTATGARCGGFIEVQGHPRKRFDRRYLVVSVKHRGSQAGLLLEGLKIPARGETGGSADFYQAEISAIPSEVQFRPEITHLWPKIEGTLNGFVDAEGSGQYAELNEKGEYKIQVPFDVTHKNAQRGSAWIRMATPYAGSDHGMHFPLHKGTEVVLSFINGDPDQPVILGAIPNSMNPNVVRNENQMQSRIRTAGGNEITLHDEAGKQHMLFKTPVANAWLRMGVPGSRSRSSGGGSSSRRQQWQQASAERLPWQGMQQMWQGVPETRFRARQQQQQTTPDDIENSATAGSSDIWINTDNGNFGVTTGSSSAVAPTDGISLTAYTHDINLTSSAGDITLSAPNGNVTQKAQNVLFTWGGNTFSHTLGTEEKLVGGFVLNGYLGVVMNLYVGAYVNFYGLKCDSTLLKLEKVYGAHLEKKGLHYTAAAAKLAQNTAKLEQNEIKLLKNGIVCLKAQAEIKQATAKIDECETKIDNYNVAAMNKEISLEEYTTRVRSCQAEIEEAETKIESAQATLSTGTKIFVPG